MRPRGAEVREVYMNVPCVCDWGEGQAKFKGATRDRKGHVLKILATKAADSKGRCHKPQTMFVVSVCTLCLGFTME